MENMIQSLRYNLRLIRRTPGFSAICLAVLTLGVTLSLCAYSIVKTLYYADLPFADGERFVAFKNLEKDSGVATTPLRLNGFALSQISARSSGFATLGAYAPSVSVVSDGDSVEKYSAATISPTILNATQVEPMLGRTLTEADALSDAAAVISYSLWQNYYAGDPDIIGRSSRVDGNPRTIVGVMPEGFAYPVNQDMWLPLSTSVAALPNETRSLIGLAVLGSQTSVSQASAELAAVLADLREQYPGIYGDTYGAVTAHALLANDSGNGVPQLLMSIASLVLLMACLNYSTLLFVRANGRQQELAMRSALGAQRWTIVAQVLSESFILCVAAVLLGLGLSQMILLGFQTTVSSMTAADSVGLPFWMQFTLDGSVALFVLGLTAFIWLATGSLVALRCSRIDSGRLLNNGGKSSSGRRGAAVGKAVVGLEVIVCFFLLVQSGLAALAAHDLTTTDYGTPTDNILTTSFDLSGNGFEENRERRQFIGSLLDQSARLGGVDAVTVATAMPGQPVDKVPYRAEGTALARGEAYSRQSVVWVKENYFRVMGIPILTGRSFAGSDSSDAPSVVIVDESFAKATWPDQSALGKRIQLNPEKERDWATVVGVSKPVLQGLPLGPQANFTMFRPYQQATPSGFTLALKTAEGVSANGLGDQLKHIAAGISREVPLGELYTLERRQALNTLEMSAFGNVFVGIALFTLVLAIIGIYGLVSRSVVTRTSEIGIRLALGAKVSRVIALFLSQGLGFILTGAVFGGGAAILAVNVLPAYFGELMLPQLPLVIVGTLTAVATLVFVSIYFPVRRATAIEPGDALRVE